MVQQQINCARHLFFKLFFIVLSTVLLSFSIGFTNDVSMDHMSKADTDISVHNSLTSKNSQFVDQARSYIEKDFPGQDFNIVFDYPEILGKLPENFEIAAYKNVGQGRAQFYVKGIAQPIGAKINLMVTVPVLNKPLSPNHVIEEQDILLTKVPLTALNGAYALRVDELLGKQSKNKVLPTLTPILTADLTAPTIVKRDSFMRVTYRSGPLSISTQAKALKDGAVGERITFEILKNPKKILEAVIIDAHNAELYVATA